MNPVFPGGTQASRMSLHGDLDTGACGGASHLHTVCTEAYIWIQGHGALELLSTAGHHLVPAGPFTTVWFSPEVIHRGVPGEGSDDAEVLVVMRYADLREKGDVVITRPERMWGSPDHYRCAVSVVAPDVDPVFGMCGDLRPIPIGVDQ